MSTSPKPHTPKPQPLDVSVAARLRAVADRLRRYVLMEGVAAVVVFLVAAAGLQLSMDYGTRGLRWSMRAALSSVILLGVLWLVWRRVVAPLRLRFGLAEVANLVERRYPELSSLLISAVRFSAGEVGPVVTNSPNLIASVIARAGPQVNSLDFGDVLDPRRARWSVLAVATALIVCVSAAAASPGVMRLWFVRNVLLQDEEWPKRTHLIVELEGGELIGARGDDLVVQAHAQGVNPREVEIVFETSSGKHGREAMVTVGSEGSYRYRYTFKNAQEDFQFYLEGGDDRTKTFDARLLERPRVTRTEMRVAPPDYTRLEAFTLDDSQRTAQLLPGSDVTIRIETNKPVTQATLMAGREIVAEASHSERSEESPFPTTEMLRSAQHDTRPGRTGQRYVATFSPLETHTYHFALVDEVGLENRRPVRFSLRVIQDEPPRVRMKLPGVGDMITPEAVLPIEVEYGDTYGLAVAELIYQISREGAEETSIALPTFKPYLTTFTTSLTWPVATEALAPGETLTLMARAADFNTVSGPGLAQSPEITLRVVTRDELLAELARREQEYRMDFERLIDAQEQVRSSLLTVLGHFQGGEGAETLPARLTPLERRQRNIAGSVNIIRQQFEQILSELSVNQLDTLDERERLGEGIIKPLTQLAKRDLVTAADAVRQWSRSVRAVRSAGSAEKASLIDPQQVAILSQMHAVLANMLQWEGYQEVVSMLRDILRLQQELHTETKSIVQDQASDVFDD